MSLTDRFIGIESSYKIATNYILHPELDKSMTEQQRLNYYAKSQLAYFTVLKEVQDNEKTTRIFS
mgnify:CR=1 FL=1